MKFHAPLWAYLFRQTRIATLLGGLMLGLYALINWYVLDPTDVIPIIILLGQSILLSVIWGRRPKGETAWLYTSGYSRDTLWWHRIFVSLCSGIISVGLGGLVVWLGLRSQLQTVVGNTMFPLMSIRETWVPVHWLEIFLLLIPLSHYALARQKVYDSPNGYFYVVAIATMYWFGFAEVRRWEITLVTGVLCLILAWTGMRLHREMEVVE